MTVLHNETVCRLLRACKMYLFKGFVKAKCGIFVLIIHCNLFSVKTILFILFGLTFLKEVTLDWD